MQATLERAIAAVTQEELQIVGSGRTDAGAHAWGQVIAFSTESVLAPAILCRAINAHLPPDIAITELAIAGPSFHPRFDAHSRVYRYLICNRPVRSPFWIGRAAHVRPRLNVAAMNAAAGRLVGCHDFSAFATPPGESRVRTMYRAECWRQEDLVTIELEANGFMRQMVRSMAGTLIRVGLESMTESEFEDVLRSGNRARAGTTAPACGLYLVRVNYDLSEVSDGSPS